MKFAVSTLLVSSVAAQGTVTISRTISDVSPDITGFVSLASGCTEHGALLRSLLGEVVPPRLSRPHSPLIPAVLSPPPHPTYLCARADAYGSNDCTLAWGSSNTANYSIALTAPITGGTFDIDLKLDGIIPFTASCPLCGANCSLTIPIIKTPISFKMPDCPITAHSLANITSFTLPATSPVAGKVSIAGTISAKNTDGTSLGSIEISAVLAP